MEDNVNRLCVVLIFVGCIALFLEDQCFAHGDSLPAGGKTIAGPGNAAIEKTKPAIVLESKVPIPPACITILNMTMFPLTIWLNDAPTDYVISTPSTTAYCWGKGVKKVSLHVADPKETNGPRVLWRIDLQ
jgi:hypothetical protein